MALYTIKDIAEACGVSKQAVYKLIDKHSQLVDTSTVKRGRKVFYSQPLFDFCLTHYRGELSTAEGVKSRKIPCVDAAEAAERVNRQPSTAGVELSTAETVDRLTTEGVKSRKIPCVDAAETGADGLNNQPYVSTECVNRQPSTVSEIDSLTAEVDRLTVEVDKLKRKNKRLKATVKELKDLLANSEAERAELIKQNSIALLALSQEKQEKRLLLPEPRKTLGEKVKGLFSRKDKDG